MTPKFAPLHPRDRLGPPASQSVAERVSVCAQTINPLFEAARPLLQALADTPDVLDGIAVAQRRQWLEHEIRIFGRVCAELRLHPDHVRHARYCLCAALDEAAMRTDWGKGMTTGVEWSTNGLAVAFAHDRQGGDGVYRIISEIMRDPHDNLDLIEVVQNILDLGFKGRYRFEADGAHSLQIIREQVQYAVATNGLSMLPNCLPLRSMPRPPRWHVDSWVQPTATRKARSRIVVGLFCAFLLGGAGYAAYEQLADVLYPKQTIPAIEALAQHLGERLNGEIAAGMVSLEENARRTSLTIRFNDMFPPGEATVHAWVGPLIAAVGQEIAMMKGDVKVVGHTDSLPAGKSPLVSNKELSEARAWHVTRILLAAGVPGDRIDTRGKGDADPVASNGTPMGRTKNRRVEITVSESSLNQAQGG
ncbi:type IVB secretion system protein IcmH/DotU [Burkholderia ubonensis]|uniref:OmpA-like domain-containing protein n=1 Tax=Burkholderia ubonensis TaxID=101571 RepID=A0A1R1JII0_9BURK|nr:type IVB secretion system protein IcmH/DotU [Burkholderia ubonensis]OMG75197.1 hypothetical protein BW685_00635 [Burkholderia ubonensis]